MEIAAYEDKLAKLQIGMSQLPQIECPVKNYFAPGVHVREITMPTGACVIGKKHKTKHFNIISKGSCIVTMEGKRYDLEAPCTFVSNAGVKKTVLVLEETVWSTIHATEETDLVKLEEEIIDQKAENLLTQQYKKELVWPGQR